MMKIAPFVLLGAPTQCDGRPGGVERAPNVLRDLGVLGAIGASVDLGDLPVRIDGPDRDPISGVIGATSAARAIGRTRDAVETILGNGDRPFMLGGCCTYAIGAVAAAARVFGRCGLVYIDGHLDLYDGETSPTGEAADMPAAAMLGKAGDLFTRAMGMARAVVPEDVALLACRDHAVAEAEGSLLPRDLGPGLFYRDVSGLRRAGLQETAADVRLRQEGGARRYWLHVDFDVLDDAVFPAVDYSMPGGLSWSELTTLVRPLLASGSLIGVSTACYNPDRDADLTGGRQIVEFLHRALVSGEFE